MCCNSNSMAQKNMSKDATIAVRQYSVLQEVKKSGQVAKLIYCLLQFIPVCIYNTPDNPPDKHSTPSSSLSHTGPPQLRSSTRSTE